MENAKSERLTKAESQELARAIASVLIEKKALDVMMYNVSESSSVTDYYINVTGRSSTQVGALADEVAYKIGLEGRDPLRIEGLSGKAWVLVDYGDVIVNVFDKPSRDFYNLDRLFTEEKLVDITDIIEEIDKKYSIDTAEEK